MAGQYADVEDAVEDPERTEAEADPFDMFFMDIGRGKPACPVNTD